MSCVCCPPKVARAGPGVRSGRVLTHGVVGSRTGCALQNLVHLKVDNRVVSMLNSSVTVLGLDTHTPSQKRRINASMCQLGHHAYQVHTFEHTYLCAWTHTPQGPNKGGAGAVNRLQVRMVSKAMWRADFEGPLHGWGGLKA